MDPSFVAFDGKWISRTFERL